MIFKHMCANIHVFRNMSKKAKEKNLTFVGVSIRLTFTDFCSTTAARALGGRGVGKVDGIDKNENYVKYLKSD